LSTGNDSPPLVRKSCGLSDIGRRRTTNEDALFADDALGLYAVADGMGGHNAGEVASQEALDTLHGMVARGASDIRALDVPEPSPDDLRRAQRLLESAVQAATYMVFGIAQHAPEQHGMGTTLSALVLAGRIAVTAQVGDSRIYLVRDGQAFQLTEDHTLVGWQVKQGIISAEDAARSPHRNVITRAIGSRDYVQVDVHTLATEPGDVFVLCSDGLHGYLRDLGELPPITALGPDAAARRLIELANERGGRDNVTALVVALS
jgi:serine/threonine protein phosphatase PrpC